MNLINKIKIKNIIKTKSQKDRTVIDAEKESPRSRALFLLMNHNKKIK